MSSEQPEAKPTTGVCYADWVKARESAKASATDVGFLDGRLKKLQAAEERALREIDTTRARTKKLLEARTEAIARREQLSAKETTEVEELTGKNQRIVDRKADHERAVEAARTQLLRSREERFRQVKDEERALRQSAAAQKMARQARLARRRERIKAVERAATDNHKAWSERRTRRLQEENLHGTADYIQRRDGAKAKAAELLVEEAAALRRLAGLQAVAQAERGKLKDTVMTPRPPRDRTPLVPQPPPRQEPTPRKKQ